MKPIEIVELLEADEPLKKFIVAFHERLAADNPKRQIAKHLTEDKHAMDALGRLLVGDEVCAAIAVDDKTIYISSNLNNHSQAQIRYLFTEHHYHINETGTYIKMMSKVQIDIKQKDGSSAEPIHKEILTAEFSYNAAEQKLTPLNPKKPKIEISLSEHGMEDYPFPFSCVLSELPVLTSVPPEQVIPSSILIAPAAMSGLKPDYRVRVDPLFRRSAVVISHLGFSALLAIQENTSEMLQAYKVFEKNRCRVMYQTIRSEAAIWYKLDKTIRRYDGSNLSRNEREIHKAKVKQLEELSKFIENLTNDINSFLIKNANRTIETSKYVKKWKKHITSVISEHKISPPKIITENEKYPLDAFLNLIATYFSELLFLEQYFAKQHKDRPDLLTETMINIGSNELLGKNTGAKLEIVDADLSEGTHAEIRLFYYLKIQNKLISEKMPYFGIAQLCCANCHTLLSTTPLSKINLK